jgi:acetolactate synthase I/II/III large subunit
MKKLTGGEVLVNTLSDHGVKYIFSIIGGQMCSIYEAASVHPKMELVTLRNEAAVPIMAGGYTAASGIPAVSMCTVGAGVVYEVAGLMDSWFSYLPVISIAPQVQSWKMKPHQENLQGCNQDEIFFPITKWNAIVYHWERIPQMVNRALREAWSNAPGPVHLDIPVDVLFKTGKPSEKMMTKPESTRYCGEIPGTLEKISKANELIRKAKQPVALIGQAMGTPVRYTQLKDKLNSLGISALTSITSSGAMSGLDERYAGSICLYLENEIGRGLLTESDLLLVIGIDPEIMDLIKGLDSFNGSIVQVEVDPSAILTSAALHTGVNADPLSFLDQLNIDDGIFDIWNKKVIQTRDSIIEKEKADMPVLAKVFEGISGSISKEDVIVVDGKLPVRAARAFLSSAKHKNLFVMNNREMAGPGLPFAIGAKLAKPENIITLITDRDSLFRHLQEMQTAAGLALDINIVIVDPGEDKYYKRTEAVLRGLGCEVNVLKPCESISPKENGRPSSWLVQ